MTKRNVALQRGEIVVENKDIWIMWICLTFGATVAGAEITIGIIR